MPSLQCCWQMDRHQAQSSCCAAVVCSSRAAVCCCLQLPCGCSLPLCGVFAAVMLLFSAVVHHTGPAARGSHRNGEGACKYSVAAKDICCHHSPQDMWSGQSTVTTHDKGSSSHQPPTTCCAQSTATQSSHAATAPNKEWNSLQMLLHAPCPGFS